MKFEAAGLGSMFSNFHRM